MNSTLFQYSGKISEIMSDITEIFRKFVSNLVLKILC